jgi:hypothetical protein
MHSSGIVNLRNHAKEQRCVRRFYSPPSAGHPDPEASESRVREAAIVARVTMS